MTIEEAIQMIRHEYEIASTLDYIKNPLAYALHQTWRLALKEEHDLSVMLINEGRNTNE